MASTVSVLRLDGLLGRLKYPVKELRSSVICWLVPMDSPLRRMMWEPLRVNRWLTLPTRVGRLVSANLDRGAWVNGLVLRLQRWNNLKP